MKKLIFTVTNDLNYDQRMQRICTSLHGAGYEVWLVGRKKTDSQPLNQQPYNQKRLSLWFQKGKLFYIEYNIRLFLYLLFNRFDIVCCIDLDTIVPGIWASGLKGKKVVYDAHEWFSEVPEVTRRPSVQGFWQRVERYAMRKVKHCYTVSETLAEQFQQVFNRQFAVIRNVPELSSAPMPGDKERVILYQGALNEGRGIESLILAMKNIEAKLVLAGEGDLSAELRNLVRANKLEDKVEFKGYVLPEELKGLTRQAYIGANLLEHKGRSYYYSLANKFFSYIEGGVPSVNMHFPEYERLNLQYDVASLVNSTEPATVAEAINRLLTDNNYYLRLRDNCLKARLELNWNKEEQKLIDFYRAI